MTNCKYIDGYIENIENGTLIACEEQKKLCRFVNLVFQNENLRIDTEQAEKYFSMEKYFPFSLFDWERFCFIMHNCVYKENGQLRFPNLAIVVGRGAGKNGYLAFEDFCLLTPINGIQKYHIDIFATSEDQAMQSFTDIYDVLEQNAAKMKRHFRWNKERIVNLKTGSELRFRTSNAKTKDGGRPGKVDFDEYHAYENYALIDVAVTGLGKKKHPRQTIISTNGNVRGAVFDDLMDSCEKILDLEEPDNGLFPFICKIDDPEEVHNPKMWHKPNPSLRFLPDLMAEMEIEYARYKQNPAGSTSFMTKRMNCPPKHVENAITSWENITACNRKIDEDKLKGKPCVAGLDFMLTTDFLGAGLLYRVDGIDYWICHTWICENSPDLNRIKAPLREWEARGLVTFVNAKAIPPELPAMWLKNEAAKRKSKIVKVGLDKYRCNVLRNACMDFMELKDKQIYLVRPSDEMQMIPTITDKFATQKIAWGENNNVMCWMANNTKTVVSAAGNVTYGKIEPKSRKNDTFKAFTAAECVSSELDKTKEVNLDIMKTWVYG